MFSNTFYVRLSNNSDIKNQGKYQCYLFNMWAQNSVYHHLLHTASKSDTSSMIRGTEITLGRHIFADYF